MNTTKKNLSDLPAGRAPEPVPVNHFPDFLHAVVWRNWDVIDAGKLAQVLRASVEEITDFAYSLGLPPQRRIEPLELRRNYMTILHRNWHLLPYEQLCELLDWDADRMQFALNEDDFMYVKFGGYKPNCPPVFFQKPNEGRRAEVAKIREVIHEEMGGKLLPVEEPLFGFIKRFREPDGEGPQADSEKRKFRMVYPYFLRYGDPLVGEGINDIPESYLAELAAGGVTAIWLQGVLNTLAPWALAPHLSVGWQERLANLNTLVQRCKAFGIEVLLYLNEPRALPRSFFDAYPNLRGVEETPERAPYSPDVVALCVSAPEAQEFLVEATRHVFTQVPDLGGVFCITFSENLTNCYSREYDSDVVDEFALRATVDQSSVPQEAHEQQSCPRCRERGPEATNALVCTLLERGMRLAGSSGRFLLYAWSTPEKWFPGLIEQLPKSTWLICVSEWGKQFTRGDYTGKVNEYSISVVGPSDQSLRQWEIARRSGLKTAAKMQAVNTYEISSIPYIPALRLVAEHQANVCQAGVNGIMLGWTAGGSPSPNLDMVAHYARHPAADVPSAMLAVAERRFGLDAAAGVVRAWNQLSDAYEEFPFDIFVCYNGPQSLGPANLLFAEPTGFAATMVTFPFDDLEGWRGPYSADTLQAQFQKLADKWRVGVDVLDGLRKEHASAELEDEWRIAEACRIHFQSTANQIRFVQVRGTDSQLACGLLQDEIDLARRLYWLVTKDSRIGFEATNQYGYIAFDLIEKILSCRQLLARYGVGEHKSAAIPD
jgi:hypothetical protein